MKPARVLVVDDEPLIRELIVVALQDAGFEVDSAANAEEAFPLVKADGYRLLITDLNMPGEMNGLDLAQRTRAQDNSVKVLIVTGRPDLLRILTKAGIPDASLAKPFALERLVRTATDLLDAA